MRYTNLTAFEYDALPGYGAGGATVLASDEIDRLVLVGELRPGFCERGFNSVRLSQYCGIVTTGRRTLEILPKTASAGDPAHARGLVLRLLGANPEMPIARQLDATHGLHSAPLLDVFIAAFFESVVHIARGGLLRLYREHEADITVVRGRVMIHRQVTALIDRRDVVACRFDDLTVDNRWNQVLKTALEEIRPYIQSADLLRRWIELFALFDEVASIEVDSRLFDRLVFDRHANRYKVAIEWARWIIATLSPEISAGPNSAPGLLFDMNVLFQEYIASAIRYQSNRLTECSVKTQDRGRFLARVPSTGATAFALRPDIVLRQHGREVAVADTKWKLVERTASGFIRPAEADMYQMHAYASRYECEHFALIYPWHAGLTGARETSFKLPPSDGREPVVYVVCIELKPSEDQVRFGGSAPMIGALLGARTPANRSDRGRASATS